VKDNAFTNFAMNSVYVQKLARNTLHSWLTLLGQDHYKAKVLPLLLSPKDKDLSKLIKFHEMIGFLKKSKEEYHKLFGFPNKILYLPSDLYRSPLEDEIEKTIDN
jgi:hypothetical protein